MYVCMYVHIYIYIERERERNVFVYVYIYIYIYIYMFVYLFIYIPAGGASERRVGQHGAVAHGERQAACAQKKFKKKVAPLSTGFP